MIAEGTPDSDSRVEEPVAALLARLSGRLRCIVSRYGVPERDMDDVLQETLVIFVHKRPEIRRPEAWLVATVRNQALMYQRRRHRRLELFHEPGHDLSLDLCCPIEGDQRQVEARLDLERALCRLPARQETAVRLRHLEDRPTEDVARRIGYRPSSIRKLVARAGWSLRAALSNGLPAA